MRFSRMHWGVPAVLALLLSCGPPSPPPAPPPQPGAKPALTIGLIPEQNIFRQLDRYRPLADYLETRAGVRLTLKILSRYGNIVDNFNSAGLDGAFFGSFTYALAHRKLGVVPVARPVGMDGKSTYHGMIFARRDRGIRRAEDLRDKRFVFVDKATTAGYLLPLDYFFRHKIADYKKFLKEYYFAGTHESAIQDVLGGRADAGAAKNTVWARLAAADPRIVNLLVVLERSPEVPENGLALRRDLDPGIRERLGQALLGMHLDPLGQPVLQRFGAQRFIETVDEDYRAVYDYAQEIGLDLATYDYVNE